MGARHGLHGLGGEMAGWRLKEVTSGANEKTDDFPKRTQVERKEWKGA